MTRPPLQGILFDVGNTLIVEEPGKHLWEMAITPVADAAEVLQGLRARFRIGLVSNTVGSGDQEMTDVLARAGLGGLIDSLVTSRDFGKAKPDPAIFVEGARRLGVPLEATCMVGDRLDTDIAGALRVGIPAIWLRYPGVPCDSDIVPTHVIARLTELPAILVSSYTREG
ncbi:MAG TPA: HAD family hydrolase [Candidatus Dormibacteraeota bacterium]|jgi:FMN phosphatase YigB (HAD superfamily)